ncbi:DUF998 domain-containing protein [Actinotalea sp. JY-7876]|uniref:DUF998 domain-containing protein n=1 Tax=Actinotalea sp. JY-7876 TaxID=2758442 RepID=UPI0015F530BF|nr:DUF998 domain-containing protein [Actinotalea sp. JY-7876]
MGGRRRDRQGSARLVGGGLAWALSGLLLAVQLAAALAWPQAYSFTANAISDLGVTTCGTFTEGGALARYVCSPWHDAVNAATVLAGLAVSVGAVLLRDAWPRRTWGRAAMVATGLAGLALAGVGLLPWDVAPDGHDVAALAQGVLQWLAMGLLVVALGRPRRGDPAVPRYGGAVRAVTAVTLAVSIVGLVLFLDVVTGGTGLGVPFGISERLAFDTLSLWSIYVGAVLVHRGRRVSVSPEMISVGQGVPARGDV